MMGNKKKKEEEGLLFVLFVCLYRTGFCVISRSTPINTPSLIYFLFRLLVNWVSRPLMYIFYCFHRHRHLLFRGLQKDFDSFVFFFFLQGFSCFFYFFRSRETFPRKTIPPFFFFFFLIFIKIFFFFGTRFFLTTRSLTVQCLVCRAALRSQSEVSSSNLFTEPSSPLNAT